MFKTGDKVKILDDDGQGVVIRVHKNSATILNSFGFEETYGLSELIPVQDLAVEEFKLLPEDDPKPKKTSPNPEILKEIDLHIGQLLDFHSGLSNFEILQIQLSKVKSEIDLARKEKRNRLVFIHGHGSGKLREELHKMLASYPKIEFYDASFRKYKLGATEVRLF